MLVADAGRRPPAVLAEVEDPVDRLRTRLDDPYRSVDLGASRNRERDTAQLDRMPVIGSRFAARTASHDARIAERQLQRIVRRRIERATGQHDREQQADYPAQVRATRTAFGSFLIT